MSEEQIIVAETTKPCETVDLFFAVYRWGGRHWGVIGGGYASAETVAQTLVTCDGQGGNPNAHRIIKVCGLPVKSMESGAV